MGKEKTPILFVNKLKESVSQYKKQLIETRDESDAAYFFDPKLKKFLKDHQEEITTLSYMNFERAFITWMKVYLLKG